MAVGHLHPVCGSSRLRSGEWTLNRSLFLCGRKKHKDACPGYWDGGRGAVNRESKAVVVMGGLSMPNVPVTMDR